MLSYYLRAIPGLGIVGSSAAALSRCCKISYLLQQVHPSLRAGFSTQGESDQAIVAGPEKIHVLKCTKSKPTPISQGVAFLVSREQIPRDKLLSNMDILRHEFINEISNYATTEISAFCAVCHKLDYHPPTLVDAVVRTLGTKLETLPGDELISVLWLISYAPLPKELLHNVANAISRHLDDFTHEDYPTILDCLARLSITDPFLHTAVTDSIITLLPEFSSEELVLLIEAYGVMGREFYDAILLNQLADKLVVDEAAVSESQRRRVAEAFQKMKHKHAKFIVK